MQDLSKGKKNEFSMNNSAHLLCVAQIRAKSTSTQNLALKRDYSEFRKGIFPQRSTALF